MSAHVQNAGIPTTHAKVHRYSTCRCGNCVAVARNTAEMYTMYKTFILKMLEIDLGPTFLSKSHYTYIKKKCILLITINTHSILFIFFKMSYTISANCTHIVH